MNCSTNFCFVQRFSLLETQSLRAMGKPENSRCTVNILINILGKINVSARVEQENMSGDAT